MRRSPTVLCLALIASGLIVTTHAAGPAVAAVALPIISHVNLGDSYSAGNGAGGYSATPPECFRSDKTWGMQLARLIGTRDHLVVQSENHACNGAIAWDVDHEEKLTNADGSTVPVADAPERETRGPSAGHTCEDLGNEYIAHFEVRAHWPDKCKYFLRPQTDWVTRTTNLVTLTIGGNDLGFREVVGKCLVLEQMDSGYLGRIPKYVNLNRTCAQYLKTATDRLHSTGSDGLEARVRRVLLSIGGRMDQTGTVILQTYPSLIDPDVVLRGSVPSDTPEQINDGQIFLDSLYNRIVNSLNAAAGTHPHYVYTSPYEDFLGAQIITPGVSLADPNPNRLFVAPKFPGGSGDAGFGDVSLWYHPNRRGHTVEANDALTSTPTLGGRPIGASRALDLALVVDTTGSMADDIISVKTALQSLLSSLDSLSPSWRVSLISYRDFPDRTGNAGDYASRVIADFSSDSTALSNAINSLTLGDGGDLPETLFSGMMTALNLNWRPGVDKRIIVMTDAAALSPEPHTGFTAANVIARAKEVDPVQVVGIPVAGSSAAAVSTLQELVTGAGGVVAPDDGADTGTALVDSVQSLSQDPAVWLGGPYVAEPGQTFTLDATDSADPGAGFASFEWDIDGDGIVDRVTAVPTLDVSFNGPFVGTASVRAVSVSGRSGKATALIRITRRTDGSVARGDGFYQPVVPVRLLDTRIQLGATHKLAAGETLALHVAGRSEATVPAGASVVLSVTTDGSSAPGFVTVWPCGEVRPVASNLNHVPGHAVPNVVVSGVGTDGTVCLYSNQSVDLIADLDGYLPVESQYQPVLPQRLLDTREPAGSPPRPADSISTVQVAGVGDAHVPVDAAGVVLNVTVTDATAAGFATLWPCGSPQPTASHLNFDAGTTRANVALSALGANGTVCLYAKQGTHFVVDLDGYLPAAAAFAAAVPQRILDTRTGLGSGADAPLEARRTLELTIPADLQFDALGGSVAINVTATGATQPGFVTVWPCGTPPPDASNLNVTAGVDVPNTVVTGIGAGGKVCFYSQVTVDLVVDVTGAFAAGEPSTGVPTTP